MTFEKSKITQTIAGVLVFVMMFYIMNSLARQFDPENYKPHTLYTEQYVQNLQRENAYNRQQAEWYEKSYDEITRILK